MMEKFSSAKLWRKIFAVSVFLAGAALLINRTVPLHERSLSSQEVYPAKTQSRTIYPYSVISGGVQSPAELRSALSVDSVAARHFAGFDVARARVIRVTESKKVYVSYRIADRVYWTRKRVLLAKGETILTDGVNTARTRCGNRISDTPQESVGPAEPSELTLEDAITLPEPGKMPDSWGALSIESREPSRTLAKPGDYLAQFGPAMLTSPGSSSYGSPVQGGFSGGPSGGSSGGSSIGPSGGSSGGATPTGPGTGNTAGRNPRSSTSPAAVTLTLTASPEMGPAILNGLAAIGPAPESTSIAISFPQFQPQIQGNTSPLTMDSYIPSSVYFPVTQRRLTATLSPEPLSSSTISEPLDLAIESFLPPGPLPVTALATLETSPVKPNGQAAEVPEPGTFLTALAAAGLVFSVLEIRRRRAAEFGKRE